MKYSDAFFNEDSEDQRKYQHEVNVDEALQQLEKSCVDSEELVAEQPAKWFIKDLIRMKQSGILGGPWKSGKSFAAIHMSKCVIHNLNLFQPNLMADLLGAKTGKVCKSGSVLYIASEDGGSLRNRVMAWDIKYDRDGKLAAQTQNKIWWYRKPVDLLNVIQVEAVKRFCKKKGVVMVIVDTLASCISARGETTGNLENDNALMTLLMENLGSIVGEIKGSGFFVHHPCKGDAYSSRGAGAIEASSRFKLQVTTTGENSRQLSLAFNNDAPADGINFSFQIESVVIGVDSEDGSEIRAGVFVPFKQSGIDPSGQEDKLLKYAADLTDESGKISRKNLKTRCEANGIANYRTPLARLKDKGFIKAIGSADKTGSTAYMELTEVAKQYLSGDPSLQNPGETTTQTLSGAPFWP